MADDSKKVARAHLVDAGVEELPDDWDVVTLGDLFTGDRGIAVGVMYPGDHDPEGVPLIKAGDLNGSIINPQPDFRISNDKHHEYRRTALEGGELLMTLVGNVGQCAVVPPRMAGWNTARAVAVMRLSDSSDTHFVQQCLLSRPLQQLMDVWSNTTVQATLNLKEIRQLPLPWPPKKSRDAIASILGALDDKIELNRRMNATLEGMARALFQSWFVDFDPVRAKLDGRKPEGLDKATAALFPDAFEESSLGPIPKGWEVLELGDLLGKEGYVRGPFGSSLKRSDMDEEGVPVYEQQHAIYNTREFRFFISDEKHKTLKRFTVRGNDLIISCSGTVGRISIIRPDDPEGIISQALLILRPDTAKATPEFLFYFLTSPQGFHSITSVSSGSVQVNIAKRQVIEAIKLVVPPRALIGAYDELARSVREESLRNLKESSTLSLLRDTLLPKLLSGELSVAHSTITKGDKL